MSCQLYQVPLIFVLGYSIGYRFPSQFEVSSTQPSLCAISFPWSLWLVLEEVHVGS